VVKGIVLDFVQLVSESSLFTSQFKNRHNLFSPIRIVPPMEGVGRSYSPVTLPVPRGPEGVS